ISCGTKNYNEKDSVLTGRIKNARLKKVFVTTSDNKVDTLNVDDKGKFTYITELLEPSYIELKNGTSTISVYLSPMSRTSLEYDFKNLYESLNFSGTDGDINNYLWQETQIKEDQKIGSDEFLRAPSYEIFEKSLINLKNLLERNLDDFVSKNGNKYENFINLEKQKQIIFETYLRISYYIQQISESQFDTEIEKEIETLVESIRIDDAEVNKLNNFIEFAQTYFMYNIYLKFNSNSHVYKTMEEYSDEYFSIINDLFQVDKTREELYYRAMNDFLVYYGIESIKNPYQYYKTIATDTSRIKYFDDLFFSHTKLDPGNPSVDFSFPDIDGKIYSLSDFRGKYVYIDIWASWCGPCRAEFPNLKALKEKYKSKNIVILGISVDEDKSQWENMVKTQNLDGIQLFAGGWNNQLCEFYKITGIPRFILLDKEGKIINANADRPSGKINELLETLAGI
ncbi:TlpA family protein disulfide reductase, partial [Bacteroidales bacterium OttesenSCG-928-I21]|nr:TlpA family protein disulfide reductase [Bacteroidales bacterium OttesenSCG-928-I21]